MKMRCNQWRCVLGAGGWEGQHIFRSQQSKVQYLCRVKFVAQRLGKGSVNNYAACTKTEVGEEDPAVRKTSLQPQHCISL